MPELNNNEWLVRISQYLRVMGKDSGDSYSALISFLFISYKMCIPTYLLGLIKLIFRNYVFHIRESCLNII